MKTFGIVALALIACGLQAAQATNVWHYSTKVKTIYPYSESSTDGSFLLAFTVNAPSCTAPQTNKFHYVRVGYNGMTPNTAKNILAVAMLAMSLDKEVSIYFDDATSNCYIANLFVTD